MKITVLASLSLFLFCANISAQSIISGQEVVRKNPHTKLDDMISDYNIYKIDMDKDLVSVDDEEVFLDLNLGDQSYKLHMFHNNLQVSNQQASTDPLLMGGSMRSGGTASLTINDGFIYGYIKQGSKHLYIEPLSYLQKDAAADLFIVYDVANVMEDKEHVCGVTKDMMKGESFAGSRTINTCRVINIAIANTYDMITKYGNNTATGNHNLGVLNNVQTNYRSEFSENIEFNVVAQYYPTSASNDPLSPNTATNDANTLLVNFRDWARGPGNAGGGNTGGATGGFGVDYTMASLWTDRDIAFGGSTGTVGLAYTPGWHHLLEDYTTSAASLMAMVTHEKGHNFSANHDASGSNFIMAPSVTLTGNWSSASVSSINSRLNSQSYLSDCSTLGAPVANLHKGATAVCVGSTIEFEDQSQYGATRTWSFTGGSPTTSTNEKPSVTYNTAGLYPVSITSTNNAGSDTYTDYVDIETAPPTPCTPSGGSGGSGGITLVSIQNLSNGSMTSGLYHDYACDNVASLDPNTSYTLTVGVSGVSRLRYFVDYNDDGDFLDANESSSTYTFSGTGNLGIPFDTPSGPVMESLLRMRVTVSNGGSIAADGCTAPSTGQVEDYSVYFEANQVFGCTDPSASNYNPNATVDDGSCTTGTATTWYQDADGDTYGNINSTTSAVTQPSGYVANSTDCDDTNSAVNPGATEICDGLDNDCDGQVDEGVTNTYYADNDGDGFGDASNSTTACSAPSGYVTNNTDCDDNDANNFPGNPEVCDGQDNDCDGVIDETVMNTFFADNDGDGYGNSSVSTSACTAPSGYVSDNTDCDDNDANNYPGNIEVCDGQDNDCDGLIDEGVSSTTYYADNDSDGYGNPAVSLTQCTQPSGYVTNSSDCDDTNASVNPAANEICDGIDNDCDGQVDEGVTTTYFADNDGDGYGNSNISTPACSAPSGYVTNSSDCDDNDANNYPGNVEVCDGQDNDCDGLVDEGVSATTYYVDNDGDGYGNPNNSTTTCTPPSGYVTNSSDCDDNDANNYPGNTEICDGQDNDCDGLVDEGVSSTTYYADTDNDGYGNPSASVTQCTQPSGYVTNSSDCNDNNASINPGANEVCDNQDNDCDGQVDEGVTNTYYADNDNDGYGDSGNSTSACSAPSGYVSNSSDCNDNSNAINPNASEICGDNIDNNCNGQVDEGCNNSGSCNGAYLIINIITQNTYRAFVNLQSSATVNNSSDVLFTAGTSIDLLPGFEVVQGAEFEATIEPCSMFTGNPVVSSTGATSVQNQILQDFAADEEVNVTIINIDNIIEAGGLMQADELTAFITKHMFQLEKGTYKLLVNNLIEEIEQDILVIK